MLHGAQHRPVEALRDLLQVLEAHVGQRRGEPRFNLLLSGALDADHFAFKGSAHIELPDFAGAEAEEHLAEFPGVAQQGMIEPVVDLVGGIPAFLDVLAERSDLSQLHVDRQHIWTLLGSLAHDARQVVDQAIADGALCERLEALALSPQPTVDALDQRLHVAGLVRMRTGTTTLRAPIFADLIEG
jgi:hypothetical protein